MNLLIGPSEEVHFSAAQALGRIGSKKPDLVESLIPTLIRLLDNSDSNIRTRVIYVILGIGGKRPDLIEGVAPKLTDLLSDEQKIVTNSCAIGFLGQINLDLATDVISKLKEFLNSSDGDVRSIAADAIAIIAKRRPEYVKDALPRLIELLNDDFGGLCASSAIEGIAEKAPEFFDVYLMELLNSSDKDDCNNAASASGIIAIRKPELVKEAILRLIELLGDPYVRQNAAYAICGITEKSPEFAKEAIPRLIELLDDPDFQMAAAFAICEIAKKTPELVKGASQKLTELLGDANFRVYARKDIADALGNICGARALPYLEKLIEDNPENTDLKFHIKGVIEVIHKRIETSKQGVESAERSLEEAKEYGCEISTVEDLLNKAKSSFHAGYHITAIEYARGAAEIATKRKEESKPKIAINLSECQFLPEIWKKIEVAIANKGNAHAKEIKLDFSTEIETRGLQAISTLHVGEGKSLEVSLRPKIIGEFPVDVKIRYKDLDGSEYSQRANFWINVALKLKEEIQAEIAEQGLNKLIIERTIYDPCKRDFIEKSLPRMKEWVNRYDPGTYWFVVSLQNNTGNIIEEWDINLEFSSALKINDTKIEGIEFETPQEAHLNSFKISVPKEYGIVIPKGGAQRVYFKLRAEKPKTRYEISGVFKSEITGEVPIRPKEFKYLCDAGMQPEAVKAELKKTLSEKEAARLALSFKTVQELDRMCDQDAKTEEYSDKILTLKNHTEGFSENFTKQVDEFSRFMEQEQMGYLDDEYKRKVRRFCTNLVDAWISEFLKG